MKRKNIFFNLMLWSVILLITLLGLSNIQNRQCRDKIIVQIDPSKPVVALTFDDGPNFQYTPQVLDILYQNNALATFFITGKRLADNDKLLKEMVASGHELANHTYTHTDLTTLSRCEMVWEVEETQNAVKKILPGYQLNYVRPPYGHYDEKVSDTICKPIVLWDIDSGDWRATDSETICSTILDSIKDGDIIIFHDDNPATVEALNQIIPRLQARGFQPITLSQLYERKEPKFR